MIDVPKPCWSAQN